MKNLVQVSVQIFILNFCALPLYADGVMDYLAKASYSLVQDKCSEFDSSVTASLAAAGQKKGCPSIYQLNIGTQAAILKKASERLFFDISKEELKDQLTCALKKTNQTLQHSADVNVIAADIKFKLPALKELKNEIQTRISQFQIIFGQLPKNLNHLKLSPKDEALKNQSEKLNEEIKVLMIQRQLIMSSIQHGSSLEFSKMIDSLDEKTIANDELFEKTIVKAVEKLRSSYQEDFDKIQKLNKSDEELPRAFKERIAQNPEFINNILSKYKIDPSEFKSLRCEVDAKYGVGADLRDNIALLGSSLLTSGVGLIGNMAVKGPMIAGRIAQSSKMVLLSSISLIANAPQITATIKSQCFPTGAKNLLSEKDSSENSCEMRNIVQNTQESNCALAIALPIVTTTASVLMLTNSTKKLLNNINLANEKLKNKIKKQK